MKISYDLFRWVFWGFLLHSEISLITMWFFSWIIPYSLPQEQLSMVRSREPYENKHPKLSNLKDMFISVSISIIQSPNCLKSLDKRRLPGHFFEGSMSDHRIPKWQFLEGSKDTRTALVHDYMVSATWNQASSRNVSLSDPARTIKFLSPGRSEEFVLMDERPGFLQCKNEHCRSTSGFVEGCLNHLDPHGSSPLVVPKPLKRQENYYWSWYSNFNSNALCVDWYWFVLFDFRKLTYLVRLSRRKKRWFCLHAMWPRSPISVHRYGRWLEKLWQWRKGQCSFFRC